MTFQQLQHITACMSTGSMSAAAQQLFTSVSNISKSLNLLEAELGFSIFHRSASGVTVTQKGSAFIRQAQVVINEYNHLLQTYTCQNPPTFSCACPPVPYCDKAFSQLCNQFEHNESMDFSLFEGSFQDCCSRVIFHQATLAIVIIPDFNELYCQKYLKDHKLKAEPLRTLQYYIKMRKGHPLLESECPPEQIDLTVLSQYPGIDYQCSPYDQQTLLYDNLDRNITRTVKKIHISSMERKIYCLKHTNAFCISLGMSANYEIEKDLVCIPLKHTAAKLCYVLNKGQTPSSTTLEFLRLLKDELSTVPD